MKVQHDSKQTSKLAPLKYTVPYKSNKQYENRPGRIFKKTYLGEFTTQVDHLKIDMFEAPI